MNWTYVLSAAEGSNSGPSHQTKLKGADDRNETSNSKVSFKCRSQFEVLCVRCDLEINRHRIVVKVYLLCYSIGENMSTASRRANESLANESSDTEPRDTEPRDTEPRDTEPRGGTSPISRSDQLLSIEAASAFVGCDQLRDKSEESASSNCVQHVVEPCAAGARCGSVQRLRDTLSRLHLPIIVSAVVLVLGASAYVAYALYYSFHDDKAVLILAIIFISALSLRLMWRIYGDRLTGGWTAVKETRRAKKLWILVSRCSWIIVFLFVVVVIVFGAVDAPENLISLGGLATLIVVSFISSSCPPNVPWTVVFCCCLLQQLMAVIVMRWDAGNDAISWFASLITWFLNFAQYGARFVFGETYVDHSFAMAVMPVLCFFMAVTSLLTQLGVLQLVIGAIGSCLSVVTRVTKTETFVSIAAIFLGPDTPIVMIKSMLPTLTTSQLHTLFCTSLATIDAGMFPVYESMGIPASQLVSASLMSAPAAIVFSKLLLPETKKSKINNNLTFEQRSHGSLLSAFSDGASASVPVIGVTLAVLVVYISALDFVNATFTYFGQRIGIEELTVQMICSYLFLPLTYLMGVAWEDCREVARLIGIKTIVNEYVAYAELAELISNRESGQSPSISIRSETIATYALCGYSNIGTVGFMVGFLSTLAPNKKADLSKMGFRALVAGSFACFSTACSAGLFYKE